MTAPVIRISARTPIYVARTADFDLGAMRVRPAALEVDCGGQTQRLEPRVMQALIALHEADGAVVSRDDLIARCWSGLAVGEDAINRVMSKLRRLSKIDIGRTFTLETIPRVGYRLKREALQQDRPPAAPLHPLVEWARARRRLLGFAALIAVAGATFAFVAQPRRCQFGDLEMVAQTQRWEMDPTLAHDERTLGLRYPSAEQTRRGPLLS